MALDAIGDPSGRDVPGPLDQARDAHAAFPSGALLAPERGHAAVRPGQLLVAVVRRVDHDGVVGNSKILQLLKDRSDVLVVLDHFRAHHVFLGPPLVDGHLDVRESDATRCGSRSS